MKNASLPLFLFKPTIIWIDDDELLLDSVRLSFKDTAHCITFNKPAEAIQYLKDYRSNDLQLF